MEKLSETVLGLVGIVLTSVVTAFKDEIGVALTGKLGANKDLEGRWTCTWHRRAAPGTPELPPICDVVRIEGISGEKVKAVGENTNAGTYKISGKMLRSSVMTLSWTGDGQRSVLGGVAVLELNTMRNKMTGRWCEVTEERGFVGGEVQWTKQS